MRFLSLALMTLVTAAPALADGLRVQPSGDIRAGALHPSQAAGCCSAGPCGASFVLENSSGRTLRRVVLESSPLIGPAELLPGTVVALDPREIAKLGPGATRPVSVVLSLPAATPSGRYSGTITARELGGRAQVELPLELEVCGRPARASLRLVVGAADLYPHGLILTSEDGCAGARFRARVVVEADGDAALGEVVTELFDLAASSVTVTPSSVRLEPGERAELDIAVDPRGLGFGRHQGLLRARDQASGAEDRSRWHLERCDEPPEDDPPDDDPADERRPTALLLSHTASRGAVRIGDLITLRCTVRNAGNATARDLVIEEQLPVGLRYASGRSVVDGQLAPEPTGRRRLRWRLDELAPGRETSLALQATVTSRVGRGRLVASAWVRWDGGAVGPADVTIEASRSTLFPLGLVTGQVGTAARGVAGVRVLLDYDSETSTDADGKFTFEAVDGGEHIVALDVRSLPPGHRLQGEDVHRFHLFPSTRQAVDFLLLRRPRMSLELRPRTARPAIGPAP